MSDRIERINLDQQTEPKQEQAITLTRDELIAEIAALNTLLGEWGRMQHALIDKAAAAQIRLQALYKKLVRP
jgi:hypothetical protein